MKIPINDFLNMLKEVKLIDEFDNDEVGVNTHFFSLMASLGLNSEVTGAYLKYALTDYHVFMMSIVCPTYGYVKNQKYPVKRPTKKGEETFKKVCELYNPTVLAYAFDKYFELTDTPRAINTLLESLLDENEDLMNNLYKEALVNLNMYSELLDNDDEKVEKIIRYKKYEIIKHESQITFF